MGYACPVCGDPQADDVHLANHLAFTALARGGDHEDWLDETVPDWAEMDDDSLADRVVDHADEQEYPQVFEDTTGHADHDHSQGRDRQEGMPGGDVHDAMLEEAEERLADEDMPDTDDVLAEARELTRKRNAEADDSETD
jgi:hypothetical protein